MNKYDVIIVGGGPAGLTASIYAVRANMKTLVLDKLAPGGQIINIGSMLSYQGGILIPGYAAAKGGIKSLTMLMANELSKYGICVNAIAPGYIATANTAPIRADKKRNKAILDRIPAGRWGTPDDLKGLCVFLAAPASDYVTGFMYACDGGWLAR